MTNNQTDVCKDRCMTVAPGLGVSQREVTLNKARALFGDTWEQTKTCLGEFREESVLEQGVYVWRTQRHEGLHLKNTKVWGSTSSATTKRVPFNHKLCFKIGCQTWMLLWGRSGGVFDVQVWFYVWFLFGDMCCVVCVFCCYIYIYAVVLLSGPSLAFWGVIIWAKFVFYKTLFVKKHYKNRGFSTFFFEKKIARANLRCYYLGQVGHF